MKRLIVLIVLVLFGCKKESDNPVSPTNNTPTPKQTYSISGYVRAKSSGSGLSGITVKVGSQTATTDNNGQYSVSNLDAGVYSIFIQPTDYDYLSSSVTLVNSNITQDFMLTWKYPKIILVDRKLTLDVNGTSNIPSMTAQVTDEKGDNTIVSVSATFYYFNSSSTISRSANFSYNSNSASWKWTDSNIPIGMQAFKNLEVTVIDSDGNKTVKTY